MAKTIKIDVYETDRNGVDVVVGNHDLIIKPMSTIQFMRVTKLITNLIKETKDNEDLSNAISGFFANAEEGMEVIDIIQTLDVEFLKNSSGAVAFLLENVPEYFTELIAISSTLNHDQLLRQDFDVFIEIAESVIEVNDFQKVMEQVKKLFKSFMARAGWNNLKVQATSTTQPKLVD